MDALQHARSVAEHAVAAGVAPETRARLLAEVQAWATLALAEAVRELDGRLP
ncbi:hypothetical protein [Cellulomonas sp.]|uniref:hypothetical protein n=1 Tax=Cellulomonas sp. TaxID=40001 RepID=UPI001B0C3C6E|nr:hypothetical protein [Cellulomonas sp.]MBO9556740.1 hypothetical protein [Cellulomonas sp.]